MILDKYCQEYNSDDLQIEWKKKINQFKIVKSDFEDFSDVFDSLIQLTEFISESDFAVRLFPGTELSELRISPVKEHRIILEKIMRIHCTQNGMGPFAITIIHDGVTEDDITFAEKNLINPFLNNIQRFEEMKCQ